MRIPVYVVDTGSIRNINRKNEQHESVGAMLYDRSLQNYYLASSNLPLY